MIILEDSRQQAEKHKRKHAYWDANGVEYKRTKLYVGDYTLPTKQDICVDTKKDLQEIIGNVCGAQHARFKEEVCRAQEAGIKLIFLIENTDGVRTISDLDNWENPRLKIMTNSNEVIGTYGNGKLRFKRVQKYPRATPGPTLAKCMITMQERYGCEFQFCRPEEAGQKIIDLLNS